MRRGTSSFTGVTTETSSRFISSICRRRVGPPAQLQNVAMDLLHVIRVMDITSLRKADKLEIQMAGE
jgi:hypothetical protein